MTTLSGKLFHTFTILLVKTEEVFSQMHWLWYRQDDTVAVPDLTVP